MEKTLENLTYEKHKGIAVFPLMRGNSSIRKINEKLRNFEQLIYDSLSKMYDFCDDKHQNLRLACGPNVKKYAEGVGVELEETKYEEPKKHEDKVIKYQEISNSIKSAMEKKELAKEDIQEAFDYLAGYHLKERTEEVKNYAEEIGVELDDRIGRIDEEREIESGDISIKLNGTYSKNHPISIGKFVMSSDEDGNLHIAYNNYTSMHKNIRVPGGKIGGGWLEIDEKEKKINIFGRSGDFGYEPRLLTTLAFIEAFPEYEITSEK
ncbi:hypothetical protein GF361_00090 [Candidatus Woesearchaeota archaeon]|nr:hypothetical protein [Candidatus Woesearchaeota archaeon]